jgi:hypothetical protein
MKLPWQRNGHNSDIRTITITVSTDEFFRLETEAVQERMSLPEYVRARLFAQDLTPRIRQMFERTQRIDQQMTEFTETLGKMAALENEKE